MVNQAGCRVGLTLADGDTRRRVVLNTLADEVPARYREWVGCNRARVHAQSQGRVGSCTCRT